MSVYTSPLEQLSGKKRSYEDLSRFIGSRSGGVPNYTLLAGAGCSISSGVRSASELVDVWRKEVFARLRPGATYDIEAARDFLTKNCSVWYNPAREYSSLFEKNFDLPRQRRMFVETEVADKAPGLGYAYLIRLVEASYMNTIFTTNFDDLISEAFFRFSETRPMLCAHDSSIASVMVTSKRPKIIKLHGDYLFDDIKSTVRETESLEDNTRKKFVEFGRDFGLIVVGYSGADRSIMDVLQYLLRGDDYFKNGVYWCIRKGEQPSEDLTKLLWRDRVYFVEIDGFDELMAALHNDLVGDTLPINTSVISDKPRSIISAFCCNSFLNDSPSPVIKRDLEKLRKQDEREQLLSVFRNLRNDAKEDVPAEEMDDKSLVKTLEIKQLMGLSDFSAAKERIEFELKQSPSKKLKEELYALRVRVMELSGDIKAAISAVDELIADDPQESEHYIKKSYLVYNHEERIKILLLAEKAEPNEYRVYNRLAECCIEAYQACVGFDRTTLLSAIDGAFESSFRCEPGGRNPAWDMAADFYAESALTKDEVKKRLDSIVERTSRLGPNRLVALKPRLIRLSVYKEDRDSNEADLFLRDITEAKLNAPRVMQFAYEWLELDAYRKLKRREMLSKRLSELDVNPDFVNRWEYLRRKGNFLIEFNGDLQGAIGSFRKAVYAGKRKSDIMRLVDLLTYADGYAEIHEIQERFGRYLDPTEKISIRRDELLAKGDIDGALSQLRATYSQLLVGIPQRVMEVHDLLLLGRYSEASSIAKSTLDEINWDKISHGELVINYQIAQQRGGTQVNKGMLRDVVNMTIRPTVKACAYYLLGDLDKARDGFKECLRDDREFQYFAKSWAIFSDERGRHFLDGLLKSI